MIKDKEGICSICGGPDAVNSGNKENYCSNCDPICSKCQHMTWGIDDWSVWKSLSRLCNQRQSEVDIITGKRHYEPCRFHNNPGGRCKLFKKAAGVVESVICQPSRSILQKSLRLFVRNDGE